MTGSDERRSSGSWLRQAAVLLVLAAALAAYFLLGLDERLSFDQLAESGQAARALLQERPVTTIAAFMGALTLVTLLCIPAVAVLQIFSGFLFGPLLGTLLSVLAQSAGGALAFLIARSAFRETFARLIGPYVARLEAGFRAYAFTYIVTLRMTPVIPYWVVNVAPSLLGVRFRPFLFGTLLGAIPLTFVYATFGAGLGEVIEAGGRPGLRDLLEPRTLALLLLALCFAFAPILVRRWLGPRGAAQGATRGATLADDGISPNPAPPPPAEAAPRERDRAPPR